MHAATRFSLCPMSAKMIDATAASVPGGGTRDSGARGGGP